MRPNKKNDRKGQDVVEYMLVMVVVGIFCSMILQQFGYKIGWLWSQNCEKIAAVAVQATPAADLPPATR